MVSCRVYWPLVLSVLPFPWRIGLNNQLQNIILTSCITESDFEGVFWFGLQARLVLGSASKIPLESSCSAILILICVVITRATGSAFDAATGVGVGVGVGVAFAVGTLEKNVATLPVYLPIT